MVTAALAIFMTATLAVAGDRSWSQRAGEIAAARLTAAEHRKPAADARADTANALPVRRTESTNPRLSTELRSLRLAVDAQAESRPADKPGPAETDPEGAAANEQAIQRGPLPGFWETVKRDVKESPQVLWNDTKAVYGNPWNLAFLVGAGGVSVALRPEADDDIEDHFRKHHTFGRDEINTLDWVGNPAAGFVMAGTWYLAGQVAQDAKTYEVGKKLASALIITDVSTVLLKVSANTESPNNTNYGWPSGHMSSTMAVATVVYDAYGPWVGVPAYGVAALEGIQRLDSREHHLSDVVFGAALGWVVAHTVMKEHAPEIFGGELVPYVDPSSRASGVAWIKSFDMDTNTRRRR